MTENDPATEVQESEEAPKDEIDEEKLLENLLTDISDRLSARKAAREENADPNFDKNKPKGKLDSTVKKNSAFVKKLGAIKENQKEALEKEFAGLNFGRYIAEAAAAIADAKFKTADIDAVVSLCQKIHQRYEDFMEALFSSFKKKFTLSKIADEPAKHKNDLKIICELTVLGVFMDKQGLGILHHEIKALIESDKEKFEHINVVLSLLRSIGEDVAGIVPPNVRELCKKQNQDLPGKRFCFSLTLSSKAGVCTALFLQMQLS